MRTVPGGMMSTSSVMQRPLLRLHDCAQRKQDENDGQTDHRYGILSPSVAKRQCVSIRATMRRLSIVLLISVCLITFLPAGQSAQSTSEPRTVQLNGIKDKITIRRDERGIPYIEAQNDEDLYFGQGYATAADRLWQMDLVRRTARGELSEVLAPAKRRTGAGQTASHLWFHHRSRKPSTPMPLPNRARCSKLTLAASMLTLLRSTPNRVHRSFRY